jgi:uncharacterized protein YceK
MKYGMSTLALVTALALGGCGTIGSLTDHPRVMGGVRNDLDELTHEPGPCRPGWLMIVDLPFSLALDLVFLPFTVIYEIAEPGPPPSGPPPERKPAPDPSSRKPVP